jgi:hypothetical protein
MSKSDRRFVVTTVTHLDSGRVAVGFSPDDRADQAQTAARFLLSKGLHPNRRLQDAWTAHGEAAFVFVIVEVITTALPEKAALRCLDAVPEPLRFTPGVPSELPSPGADRRRPGVYLIVHGAEAYVGSASETIDARWAVHRCQLRQGTHSNVRLGRLWEKHGATEAAFRWVPWLNVPPTTVAAVEQVLISEYRVSGKALNTNPSATTRLGTTHDEQGRKNISDGRKGKALKPESQAKANASRTGQKQSEETKKKRADAHRGTKRGDDAKANIAEAAWTLAPEQRAGVLSRYQAGELQKDIASSLGVHRSVIGRICRAARLAEDPDADLLGERRGYKWTAAQRERLKDRGRKVTPEIKAAILAEPVSLGDHEVAAKYDLGYGTVYRIRKEVPGRRKKPRGPNRSDGPPPIL